MFCSKCGAENSDEAKFCKGCGQALMSSDTEKKVQVSALVQDDLRDAIKCASCGFEGQGRKGRRLISQILIWFMLPIFWPVILIYYMVTRKYFCPQCGSDFLGVKDKNGIYKAQSTGYNPIIWILVILVTIAIIGILAAVVLASLNSARDKGADASVKATLSSLKAQAELYYDSNSNTYSGFCNSSGTKTLTNSIPEARRQNYTCNDDLKAYAISAPLSNSNYYCVDSSGAGKELQTTLGVHTSCDGTATTAVNTEAVSWRQYDAPLDSFSINFPVNPTVDTQVKPANNSSTGYRYRTYTASDGASSYFVAVYLYAEPIDVSDPQTLLKAMVSNISEGGQLISSSYHSNTLYPEIEFTVKSGDEMLKGKAVLVGQTPHLIMYNYFPSNYNEDTYKNFVRSLKFN